MQFAALKQTNLELLPFPRTENLYHVPEGQKNTLDQQETRRPHRSRNTNKSMGYSRNVVACFAPTKTDNFHPKIKRYPAKKTIIISIKINAMFLSQIGKRSTTKLMPICPRSFRAMDAPRKTTQGKKISVVSSGHERARPMERQKTWRISIKKIRTSRVAATQYAIL